MNWDAIAPTITAVATFVAACGALVAAIVAGIVARRNSTRADRASEKAHEAAEAARVAKEEAVAGKVEIIAVGNKVVELGKQIDGRMSDLLIAVKAAARAEGVAAGEQAQRDRDMTSPEANGKTLAGSDRIVDAIQQLPGQGAPQGSPVETVPAEKGKP